MPSLALVYSHLATVLPAAVIGAVLLVGRKGTLWHRRLGKIYMALMIATATLTLLIPAVVGPRAFGHFGFIHALSVLTLWAVPAAYFAARRGNISMHRNTMRFLYLGGIVIAGMFALMPGRLLHGWLFA